jgi:hypothetical protein
LFPLLPCAHAWIWQERCWVYILLPLCPTKLGTFDRCPVGTKIVPSRTLLLLWLFLFCLMIETAMPQEPLKNTIEMMKRRLEIP